MSQRPGKIMFLMRALTYGGAQRQLVTLALGLQARGYRVVVAVFYPDGPLEAHLRAAGIPIRSLEKRGRWDIGGFAARLLRLLGQEQPDVLHSYLGVENILTGLARPLLPRTRVVWGVRNTTIDLKDYSYGWLARMLDPIEQFISHRADLIISNSQAGQRDALAAGFAARNLIVIPNGIDVARFQPDAAGRAHVRAAWGLPPDAPLIGLVGRLAPQKDHATFLRAAALLAQEQADVRFVCIGTGPDDYRQRLEQLGARLGARLIWAGGRNDMPAVYNALDIAVLPSAFGEGFSNVIGEAMACGVPCVVADVGDSAWIVGDERLVVPPRDPAALAACCRALLARLPTLDQAAIRARIVHNFSVELLVERSAQAMFGPGALPVEAAGQGDTPDRTH